MTDDWRPVVGFKGYYEISDSGTVRGCERVVGAANHKTKVIKPKPLKPFPQQPSGHLYVHLYRNRKRYHRSVHRMVLESFVGPCPDGMEGCHRDGDESNNNVANLMSGTHCGTAHTRGPVERHASTATRTSKVVTPYAVAVVGNA